jgi:hypothetical protein
MAPPATSAPALDGVDGGEVHAAGDGEGNAGFLSGAQQDVQVVAGLGLFIQAGVEFDELGAEGARLLSAGDLVGNTDEINDDALAVCLGGLEAPAMVESSALPRTETKSAPALKAMSASSSPASMVFMSAKTILSGWASLTAVTAESPAALIRGVQSLPGFRLPSWIGCAMPCRTVRRGLGRPS